MDAILEPPVDSPALPDHLKTLGDLFAREQARREGFYEEIVEKRKAETSSVAVLEFQVPVQTLLDPDANFRALSAWIV